MIEKGSRKGVHRKKRERAPIPGMMIHQDGSRHEWLLGQSHDLIVTMDDATNEHYSMFLVGEKGTGSSFQGVSEVIAQRGLFCTFYSDRGSHYWTTREAGGKVEARAKCKNTKIAAQFKYARKFLLRYRHDAHKSIREHRNAIFFTTSLR